MSHGVQPRGPQSSIQWSAGLNPHDDERLFRGRLQLNVQSLEYPLKGSS